MKAELLVVSAKVRDAEIALCVLPCSVFSRNVELTSLIAEEMRLDMFSLLRSSLVIATGCNFSYRFSRIDLLKSSFKTGVS